MAVGSILLVDDEAKILNALANALRGEGHEVVASTSPREAQRLLSQRMFDLFIVDNLMPDVTGLDLIRELHAAGASDRPQIVMMTAHATVESAIEAMKLGAFDYLQKPFEVDELLVVASRALDHQRLRTEHRYLIASATRNSIITGSSGAVGGCRKSSARPKWWPVRRARCSSPAKPAPARRWSPGPFTITADSEKCR
jgi:DNA-binding NtrC family response regulator